MSQARTTGSLPKTYNAGTANTTPFQAATQSALSSSAAALGYESRLYQSALQANVTSYYTA